MYNKKSILDIDVKGKRVIARCDFNVPLDGTTITNAKRIIGAVPTIKYLSDNGARVILCSHLGRPHNVLDEKVKLSKKELKKIDELPEAEREAAKAAALEKAKDDITKLSLRPVADKLAELLGKPVAMAKDVVGPDAAAKAAALKDGDILLLETVRFHAEEEKNDPEFARALASLADIYVNDAFGTAHRAHASTAGIADYLPAVCGLLIEKELEVMGGALDEPKHPFVAILGGAKVSDKIGVINNLLEKVDTIIIGGGMAYTFVKAAGGSIGHSLFEEDKMELAASLVEKAKAKGVKFLLPVDNRAAREFSNDSENIFCSADAIPDGFMGLDIGPETIKIYSDAIKDAKTVVWNGPMGVCEFDNYAIGTKAIAEAVADSGAISIVGGGDSTAAIEKLGYGDRITHISTGGGASLEFLEGLVLPGIACLDDKQDGRKIVIAGNWKMNKTPAQAAALAADIAALKNDKAQVVICVPYVDIFAA
ncbi:MAG: phosphoglycerate kinase, partial [Clostridia bacterium]|nr:phosphoglycerate kinase [Clostridia bacterium]